MKPNKKDNIIHNLFSKEYWDISIYIMVFLSMYFLSKNGIIEELNEHTSYIYSLAALLLSISQICPKIFREIFYFLGLSLFFLVGFKINLEIIQPIISVIKVDEDDIMFLSTAFIFVGIFINRYNELKERKNIEMRNNQIADNLNKLNETYWEEKQALLKEHSLLIKLINDTSIPHKTKELKADVSQAMVMSNYQNRNHLADNISNIENLLNKK